MFQEYIQVDQETLDKCPQSGGAIKFKTTNFYLMYGFFDPQVDFLHMKKDDDSMKSLSSNKINDAYFDEKEDMLFVTDME